MAVLGPVLAANSEKIGGMILRTGKTSKKRSAEVRDPMLDEEIALVEAATADLDSDAAVRRHQEGHRPRRRTGHAAAGHQRGPKAGLSISETTDSGETTLFQMMLRPRWIGALVLALALAAGFAWLGQWQLERAVESGKVIDAPSETVLPLAQVAKPNGPITDKATGQLVTFAGTFVPRLPAPSGSAKQGHGRMVGRRARDGGGCRFRASGRPRRGARLGRRQADRRVRDGAARERGAELAGDRGRGCCRPRPPRSRPTRVTPR